MTFDLSDTIQPTSDQLDAVDLLPGARTFTIERVTKGNAEQPVDIHLADFPRPWRPGKSMRRVLVSCWGVDASAYVGRRVRLYCDPDVVFGGQAVGGTRIAALSHIDKSKKIPLLVSRGKSAIFIVKPLADDAPAAAPTAPAEDGITASQLTALNAAMTQDLNLKERADKLAHLTRELGREIGSSKDVTKAEASRLLDGWTTERNARAADAVDEPPADWQGEPFQAES